MNEYPRLDTTGIPKGSRIELTQDTTLTTRQIEDYTFDTKGWRVLVVLETDTAPDGAVP